MTVKSLLVIASALALAACAGEPGEPDQGTADPTTGQVMLQTEPAACNLQQSGLAYPTEACSRCMQSECCAETTACFGKTNGGCSALHACIAECPVGSIIVAGSGSDGGNPCLDQCGTRYASSLRKHETYEACIRTKCMPACDQ